MGYKVFVAGEEALAADVNALLMAQTVSRFPSAATRAAQLTAPVTNQLSILDDRPGIVQRWNGSAWVDNTATLIDSSGGSSFGPLIQTGSTVATTDAFGSLNINFPTAFANADRRVTASNGSVASSTFFVGIVAGNPSGVTLGCAGAGGPIANSTLRVDWIAIGVRP